MKRDNYDVLSREPAWSIALLIIDNELVSQLLTREGCIRMQEEAFKKSATRPLPSFNLRKRIHVCDPLARA
jgi:hypothetical protein